MRSDWRVVPLGEAAEVTIGRQRSPKNASGPDMAPYLRAANVKDDWLVLDDILEMNFDDAERATYALRPGDVLVTEGCGSIRELGASARWDGQVPGIVCFQNTLLRLRAVEGMTTASYLDQWARWAHRSGTWASVASGTNILHIGVQRARGLTIGVPPLAEQERITDFLQAFDATVERGALLAEAATRYRTTFIADWFRSTRAEPIALEQIADVTQGSALPKHLQGTLSGTVPWFKIADMAKAPNRGGYREAETMMTVDEIGHNKGRVLPRGAVTFPRVGAAVLTEKKRALLIDAACDENHLVVIPRDGLDPAFLLAYFENLSLRSLVQQGAVPSLNQGLIRSLRIPLPDETEQQRVASVADQLRIVALAAQDYEARVRTLRSAVAHGLLSGSNQMPDSYDELLGRAS